jgi:hypothetical protein
VAIADAYNVGNYAAEYVTVNTSWQLAFHDMLVNGSGFND